MIRPILTFEDIRRTCLQYLKDSDVTVIERAYRLAEAAHADQLRKSGEPYIQHPLAVALTLAELRLDAHTLAAAFLHDVVEDTPNTIGDIRWRFGRQIANLVDGVTKLDRLQLRTGIFNRENKELSGIERRIESLRKMLLATSKDVRVVLIRLADRLHNMETLGSVPKEKQYEIAKETLEIYAPLAYRLGMGTIKGQLEDLAFAYVSPDEYKQMSKLMGREAATRERSVRRAKQGIYAMLAKRGIKPLINARVKHLYSLYRKLGRYNNDLSQIYDLVACRILVDTVEECYEALGLIHQRWKPIEGRVKDYIASPKPNGYQSLHTTVIAFDDKPLEIQIRTKKMHEQAEFGIAAHWHYSEQKGTLDYLRRRVRPVPRQELAWVNELARWQRNISSYKDLDQLMKIDFFGDRIFVYTPKGDVIDLPVGATPIDFAFAVHTDIGNHLSGAKVNGKIVRLSDELHSGETVDLMVSKKANPTHDWLKCVKTSHAKECIRRAMRNRRT
jgi:GTP pyrophosphokinase